MNSLSLLNDFELETSLKDLVYKERKLLHIILEHIKEIDRRKVYLERAYSSLYEYLVKELNYSGSAAMRRIEAARLLRDVPLMKDKIQNGTINLSQIGELAKAIKEKEKISENRLSVQEKAELVAVISGKTTQETQRDLAQVLNIEVKQIESKRIQQDESVRCELTFSKELDAKLKRCKEKLSHRFHGAELDHSLVGVIEILANEFLKEGNIVVTDTEEKSPALKLNKTLTPKVKLQVIRRDKCCQYHDPVTGRICGSTYFSQVDHKTSRWAGGGHDVSNLQVLCGKHNRYKYLKESGVRLL